MNCADVQEVIIDSDNGQPLPEAVTEHLHSCAACRRFAATIAAASDSIRLPAALAANPELTARIMAAVRLEAESRLSRFMGNSAAQPVALKGWLIAGAVIIASLLLMQFSDIVRGLRASLGPAIDVAVSLALGIGLTAYICLLVVSNHAGISRWLDDGPFHSRVRH